MDPGDITLVTETFERPDVLCRMLASVRRAYSGPVIVAYDSGTPFVSNHPFVKIIELPFDSGVGTGRNTLIDAVSTKGLWMSDDDMIALANFDVARPLTCLSRNPEVDLCGGRVIDLPRWRSVKYSDSVLFRYSGELRRPLGTIVDGLPVVYKVPNFYVARTERVRKVRYDDRPKGVDHNDFFTSAYGKLLCVYDHSWACLHVRSKFDPHYMSYRMDQPADFAYLAEKWNGSWR
ncbi:MAG: hypothetical protein JXA57_20660 [Armatimonadetes bacterium]|nr:hypothetical protein [Armatimonadota bacterium]